jgi:hypothetical protein
MSVRHSLHLTVTVLVYFTAISLGAGLFVVNTDRGLLLLVPVLVGAVLLGHAVKTAHLDELGYAIMWAWAGLLAVSVVGTVTEVFVLQGAVSPVAEPHVARVLGTFSFVTVLVVAYLRGVRTAPEGGSRWSLRV